MERIVVVDYLRSLIQFTVNWAHRTETSKASLLAVIESSAQEGADVFEEQSLAGLCVIGAINGLELFGHERGNIEVFKILRKLGAEVIVGVNARDDNHVGMELNRLGFVTFPLPYGPQWSIQWVKKEPVIVLTNMLAVLRCSWRFYRAMLRFRPTHVHLGSPLAYSYIALALLVRRVPLIYRMGDQPPIKSVFNLWIWRRAAQRSAWIIGITDFVKKSIVEAGIDESKVSVIYSVAPQKGGAAVDLDASYDKAPHETRLLYVGAVSKHKGLVPLLQAFEKLSRKHRELHLDILGGSRYDAPFRSELMNMVARFRLNERVFFHGHVGSAAAFYRRAAIHVAPSLCEEGGGNVVLEAKCAATPSVIFPSGGMPELVRHEIDGYVCREKSAAALAEALSWVLADPERLAAMSRAARDDSDARFSESRFAKQWAAVYRTSVGQSSHGKPL